MIEKITSLAYESSCKDNEDELKEKINQIIDIINLLKLDEAAERRSSFEFEKAKNEASNEGV